MVRTGKKKSWGGDDHGESEQAREKQVMREKGPTEKAGENHYTTPFWKTQTTLARGAPLHKSD